MAYIPPAAAGIDPWVAYREKFGPVSTHEKNMGIESATSTMKFFSDIGLPSNEYLSLNTQDECEAVNNNNPIPANKVPRLHDVTQNIVDHLFRTFLTLPTKVDNVSELQALYEKACKMMSLQGKIAEAYKRSVPPNSQIPLKNYDLKFVNYTLNLGKTEWVLDGDKIDVIIIGSMFYNPCGRGLKIELKGDGHYLGEAFFQELGDELRVTEVKSYLNADPVTKKYDFIFLLTKIIFNVWEAQGDSSMSLYLNPKYFESTALGLEIPENDHTGECAHLIVFRKEKTDFEFFSKILKLNSPLIPKCD